MFNKLYSYLGLEHSKEEETKSNDEMIDEIKVEVEQPETEIILEEKTHKDKLVETCEKLSREICQVSEKLSQNVSEVSKKTVERIYTFTENINKEISGKIASITKKEDSKESENENI